MTIHILKLVNYAVLVLAVSLLAGLVTRGTYIVHPVLRVACGFMGWREVPRYAGVGLMGCLLAWALVALKLWSVCYLHWRTPRNRGGGRRTWFDQHRDLLEDPSFDVVDISAIIDCPTDGQNTHPGRKLARVCGGAIRRAMGFPDRTRANIVLASQRCDAWLRENCPNLRRSDFEAVHARAVVVALTATRFEERMGEALYSPRASRAQHVAHTPHLIPMYEGALGRALSYLGFEVPSVQNF